MEKMIQKENWPMLLDMTKEECKKSLRALELAAYSQVISVFRAQGELTKEKRKILTDLQAVFLISLERHRAEIRRAVNDEKLYTIAETLAGPNTGIEWAIEGRRLIPLMPRVAPQVAYTALATRMAQMYYGINTKLPPPSRTAKYGKFDDLGAESDETDSEEETEGLRFIHGSMVPPQFNKDHGAFTSLPKSQARLVRQQLKEMKETQEALQAAATAIVSTSVVTPTSPPTVLSPTPISSCSNSIVTTSTCSTAVISSSGSNSDKRKRKRSTSTEHTPLPQPPTTTIIQQFPIGQTTPTKQIGSVSRSLSGTSMKITVAGTTPRPVGSPVSTLSSHTQKVILVSTSGASGVGGGMYPRSVSVPMVKTSNTITSTVASGNIPPHPQASIRCGPITTATISNTPVYSGAYVSRMRPRLPSVANVPRAARQRSNSLVLHSETTTVPSNIRGRDNIQVAGSALHSQGSTNYPNSATGIVALSGTSHPPTQLITHQTIQVRPGTPVTPAKTAIHIRQEGGAKIITHGMGSHVSAVAQGSAAMTPTGGGRMVGRASMPTCAPPSAQGLFVVSTNSGSTITVVTRTVAAGQGLRPATPTSVVSLGSKTVQTVRVAPHGQGGALRPVMGVSKSNVIVVHKGGGGAGTRPMGFQTVRDGPTKITIGKAGTAGSQGTINTNIQGNVMTGAILGKPTTFTRALSSITAGTTAQQANNLSNAVVPPGQSSNMIVVEMSQEAASTTSTSTNTNNSALADILQATGILSGSSIANSQADSINPNQLSNQQINLVSSTESGTCVSLIQSGAIAKSATSVGIPSTTARISLSNVSNLGTIIVSSAPSIMTSVSALPSVLSSVVTPTVASTPSLSLPVSVVTDISRSAVSVTNTPVMQSQPSLSSPEGTTDEWMGIGLDEELEDEEMESQEDDSSSNQNAVDGQMQILEEAAENLGRGDKERARNILEQAGIEFVDSPSDGQSGSESLTVGNMISNNPVVGSAAQSLGQSSVVGSSTDTIGHPPELDPATGLFYNPSATESSSESNLSTSVENSKQLQHSLQEQEDTDAGKES